MGVGVVCTVPDHVPGVFCLCADGPLIDMEFTPATETVALGAMGTPSEFDRRKKKK